jgi:hypothetical protein
MKILSKLLLVSVFIFAAGFFVFPKPALADYNDGCQIAFRASNGQYVVAEDEGGGDINANRDAIGSWETFTLFQSPWGGYFIRTVNGSTFWQADNGGGGDLRAVTTNNGTWEHFEIVDAGGGQVAFRTWDGHYAKAAYVGGAWVAADGTDIGSYESFTPVMLSCSSASYVSQSVPTTMTAGQSTAVSVTMTNTGGTTWSAGEHYKLGSQNLQDNGTWGTGRVYMPYSVGSGETVTFNFNITAPGSIGTYNFQWRMLRENVEWFGDYTPNVAIQVTPAAPPPTASISANPTSVSYNGSSTITWSSTNATSCSVSPPSWTGTSGAQSTGSLTVTTTYTVSCSGPGGSASASVIVSVAAPPAPTCSSAGPDGDGIDSATTTHTSYVYDAVNTTSALFAVWSETNGQDDLIWWPGSNQGSGTWVANVNMASHPGYGTVFVYAYIYNGVTQALCDTANVTRVKTGTVKVRIDAGKTWTLTGPYGYSSSGTGNADLTNLKYGIYTLTPQAIAGYTVTTSPSSTIELKD